MSSPIHSPSIVVDPDELRRIATEMGTTRGAFDTGAASMPDPAGTGWAEELIASILAAVTTSATDMLVESDVLSAIADRCSGAYTEADTDAAVDLLLSGDGR